MTPARRAAVRQAAAWSGVTLTPRIETLLGKYLDLLAEWNRQVNLTGTREESEIIAHHVADAMALVPHLPPAPHSVLDVGSGGGLPGVVLAIFRPDATITLLEPVRRRHTFLTTVALELPLANVRVLAERDEHHLARPDFRPHDIAVSRATWPVPEWLGRARALVRVGGVILAVEDGEPSVLPAPAARYPFPHGPAGRAVIRSG